MAIGPGIQKVNGLIIIEAGQILIDLVIRFVTRVLIDIDLGKKDQLTIHWGIDFENTNENTYIYY